MVLGGLIYGGAYNIRLGRGGGGGGAYNLMDEEKAFQNTLHIALLIKRLF